MCDLGLLSLETSLITEAEHDNDYDVLIYSLATDDVEGSNYVIERITELRPDLVGVEPCPPQKYLDNYLASNSENEIKKWFKKNVWFNEGITNLVFNSRKFSDSAIIFPLEGDSLIDAGNYFIRDKFMARTASDKFKEFNAESAVLVMGYLHARVVAEILDKKYGLCCLIENVGLDKQEPEIIKYADIFTDERIKLL